MACSVLHGRWAGGRLPGRWPEETPSTVQDRGAERRRGRPLATDRDETSRGTPWCLGGWGRHGPGWDDRPSGVKGRIGVREDLPETRVARVAGCRLEQKVGYGRHTDRPSRQ